MRFLFLAPCLLLSTVLFADTYRYIVFKERFQSKEDSVVFDTSSKGTGEKALIDLGKKDQPQPSENTQFIVVKNTAVAVLEVSFQDDNERALFEKMNSDGRLALFSITRNIDEGSVKRVETVFSSPLPVDITKDWSVQTSSKDEK